MIKSKNPLFIFEVQKIIFITKFFKNYLFELSDLFYNNLLAVTLMIILNIEKVNSF